jgi:hypothetical protein
MVVLDIQVQRITRVVVVVEIQAREPRHLILLGVTVEMVERSLL